jgi:NAD+ kinase
MRIGLYGRNSGVNQSSKLKILMQILQDGGHDLYVCSGFLAYLQAITGMNIDCRQFSTADDVPADLDFLLSAGGDGTFLEASQFAVERHIPVLGINFGRLGFLAQVSANDMQTSLQQLFSGDYCVESRSLIDVACEGVAHRALNEITVQRSGPVMLKTTVWIDGELLSSYWSDGILVSTPTGSTAYSLSVGGPVLLPETRSFIIAPIAPHNLNLRPIVIPDDSEIAIAVETRKGNAILSVDNTMSNIDSGIKLLVKKSKFVLKFVKLKDYNFLKTLHNKLNWGTDIRN